VAGDWNRTGHTGIGAFDPATATWYLRNEPSAGPPDAGAFTYGAAGWLPVVGDWNGDATTTVGVIDPGTETWYLRNGVGPGAADAGQFVYGLPGWRPVVGDWSGAGRTGIGVVDPNGVWYLRNLPTPGVPDVPPFGYGLGGWTPLVGGWASPAAPRPAAAASGGVSDHLAADTQVTGLRRTPALDQALASFRKANGAATDAGGVTDNFG
jgi:hypothetical protein